MTARVHILSWALVSSRVLVQVQLVVFLGIPPLASRDDLSRHRLLEPLLVDLVCDLFRNLLLLLAMCEDHTAVLGADIPALAIQRRRIVHTIEEFEKLAVGHNGGIKGDLEGFGICGKAKENREQGIRAQVHTIRNRRASE